MIVLNSKKYSFCPFCGSTLEVRMEEDKERQACSHCNWTYYPRVAAAVGGVIMNNERVLMVRRGREPYRGTWMFPAGFVEYGEHPEEALVREVKEETGLVIHEWKYFTLLQSVDDPRSPGHFSIFYRINRYSGELVNDGKENEAIQWFPINDLPTIGWQTHQEVAKLLLQQS